MAEVHVKKDTVTFFEDRDLNDVHTVAEHAVAATDMYVSVISHSAT